MLLYRPRPRVGAACRRPPAAPVLRRRCYCARRSAAGLQPHSSQRLAPGPRGAARAWRSWGDRCCGSARGPWALGSSSHRGESSSHLCCWSHSCPGHLGVPPKGRIFEGEKLLLGALISFGWPWGSRAAAGSFLLQTV